MPKLSEFSNNKKYKVTADYYLNGKHLNIHFEVRGPIKNILSQEKNLTLRHGKNLWQKTCFESFFFNPKKASYVELNFNTNGEYCFLYFKSYRKKTAKEKKFKCLSIERKITKRVITIKAQVSIPKGKKYLVSPTVILVTSKGKSFYYALKHGKKPDFHKKSIVESAASKLSA